ncbi:hypothetical protein DPEC_G00058600 [Dallia pectoralis]|uniref:Uncharacterized protein n=1 Tax=Dallia pectoralis TaxID=75939 RepID=A0ACC2H6V0_DALPE|nr:hypothetical protein DPEC_G00058600 [Dallia pectoralis]
MCQLELYLSDEHGFSLKYVQENRTEFVSLKLLTSFRKLEVRGVLENTLKLFNAHAAVAWLRILWPGNRLPDELRQNAGGTRSRASGFVSWWSLTPWRGPGRPTGPCRVEALSELHGSRSVEENRCTWDHGNEKVVCLCVQRRKVGTKAPGQLQRQALSPVVLRLPVGPVGTKGFCRGRRQKKHSCNNTSSYITTNPSE